MVLLVSSTFYHSDKSAKPKIPDGIECVRGWPTKIGGKVVMAWFWDPV